MNHQQDNFGGAVDNANNAAVVPQPIQEPQIAHEAEEERDVQRIRQQIRLVGRFGNFMLLELLGEIQYNGARGEPEAQQDLEEQQSRAQAQIFEKQSRELKGMGTTKNFHTIRGKYGREREEQQHKQNNVVPHTKAASRTGDKPTA